MAKIFDFSDKKNDSFEDFYYIVDDFLNSEIFYEVESLAIRHVIDFKNKRILSDSNEQEEGKNNKANGNAINFIGIDLILLTK